MRDDEMIERQERRHQLSVEGNCQFVEPREFLDYATSRRRLQRVDDPAAGIHGLLDLDTGMRFFVEDEKLFSLQATEL